MADFQPGTEDAICRSSNGTAKEDGFQGSKWKRHGSGTWSVASGSGIQVHRKYEDGSYGRSKRHGSWRVTRTRERQNDASLTSKRPLTEVQVVGGGTSSKPHFRYFEKSGRKSPRKSQTKFNLRANDFPPLTDDKDFLGLDALELSPECQKDWSVIVEEAEEEKRNTQIKSHDKLERLFDTQPKKWYQEIETDTSVLMRRDKQIMYGKTTVEYQRYISQIPVESRAKHHPHTPKKNIKYSRRSWDTQIRNWRRVLHVWDAETIPKSAQNDEKQTNVAEMLTPDGGGEVTDQMEDEASKYEVDFTPLNSLSEEQQKSVVDMDIADEEVDMWNVALEHMS